MSRAKAVPGEKPIYWVGSAKHDLMQFPGRVKDEIGAALSVAQFGGKHPKAKPWKGEGPGVFEIVSDYRSDTYRAVYTVRFVEAIFVLHAFQKKSPTGVKTTQRDVELIARRIRMAREVYEAQHGKENC